MSKFHSMMRLSVLTTELKLGTQCKNEKSNLLSSNEMANNQLPGAFRSCAIQDVTVKQRAPVPANRDSHAQPCNCWLSELHKTQIPGIIQALGVSTSSRWNYFLKFQGGSDELISQMTH